MSQNVLEFCWPPIETSESVGIQKKMFVPLEVWNRLVSLRVRYRSFLPVPAFSDTQLLALRAILCA